MAKILCVLYDDPIGGYPKSYARDGIPENRPLSRRSIGCRRPEAYRFQAGRASRLCLG